MAEWWRPLRLDAQFFAADHPAAGLGPLAVDGQFALLDPLLQAAAGEIRKQFNRGLVQPGAGGVFGNLPG